MRLSESAVAQGTAFLAIIEEVRPRISVGGLEIIYQSTGRHWIGRRTRRRSVYWEAKRRTVDPSEVYRLCLDGTHATPDLHRAQAGTLRARSQCLSGNGLACIDRRLCMSSHGGLRSAGD